jgi:hypothetical protein
MKHHVQGEHHAAGGRAGHHAADGGTGLGMERPASWPAYEDQGHHLAMAWRRDLARPDFRPGISSHAEAFEGPGSDEAGGGVDPTGQSGGTMVSPVMPIVR